MEGSKVLQLMVKRTLNKRIQAVIYELIMEEWPKRLHPPTLYQHGSSRALLYRGCCIQATAKSDKVDLHIYTEPIALIYYEQADFTDATFRLSNPTATESMIEWIIAESDRRRAEHGLAFRVWNDVSDLVNRLTAWCQRPLQEPIKLAIRTNRMATISFTKVKLPFGWLGNMAPFPITVNGETWRTAEALFQAMRFDDPTIQQAIRSQTSPMAAKMVAKKHKADMAVVPCSDADVENMLVVLRLKLQQHPDLRAELRATGRATLVEDCTARPNGGSALFWGAAQQYGVWVGENRLGKLWMRLRDEL